MKTNLALALLAALQAPALAFGAAPDDVKTRIAAVTVYADRALVQRVGRHDLAVAGDLRLRITGLPQKLEDASVRLLVGGSARPTLVGFAVETTPTSDEVAPEARALEESIRKQEAEERALEARQKELGEQRAYLATLRSSFDAERWRKSAPEKIDVLGFEKAEGQLAAELTKLATEVRGLELERRVLRKKLELERRQLEQLRGKRGTSTKAVTFDLRVRKTGKLTLTLRYLVPDVRWRSLYDARLQGTDVRLRHFAVVTQESGEDWSDVKLSVSTAEASRLVRLTALGTRQLGVSHVVTVSTTESARKQDRTGGATPTPSAPPPPPPPAEVEVRQSEFVTTYETATRVAIPSSPAGRKTELSTYAVSTTLQHVAVPSRAQGAYLTAKGKGPALPLPAGEVSLFLGDEFVGQTSLATVAPGAELRLPFGRDERVKVRRVVLEQRRETKGVFSKRERHQRRYDIQVENDTGREIELVVFDQHPVPQHSDIEVALEDETSPRATPERPDPPGVLRWQLKLGGGEKKTLRFGYVVSHPAGRAVYGLF